MSEFQEVNSVEDVTRVHVSQLKPPASFTPPSAATADSNQPVAVVNNPAEPRAKTAEAIKADQAHPLKKFTLMGSSAYLESIAAQQKPILGRLCLLGQLTVWYAPPNTGKTLLFIHLLINAVESGSINPDDVIYANVDDTSAGLAEKVRILEELGVHTIGEGERQFTAKMMIPAMRQMIESGQAKGSFVVLDTLKRFTSLMDKRESSAFAQLCRQFALKGGTILALAHTNKRPNPDGRLIYSGTSDIVDDFDCAYILGARPEQPSPTDKVVEFENIKKRGSVDARAVYAYSTQDGISYDQCVASVRQLSIDGFLPLQAAMTAQRTAELAEAIAKRIATGPLAKMALAKLVAQDTGAGRHAIVAIIDQYTGRDPQSHRWVFERKERGAKVFTLLEPAVVPEADVTG